MNPNYSVQKTIYKNEVLRHKDERKSLLNPYIPEIGGILGESLNLGALEEILKLGALELEDLRNPFLVLDFWGRERSLIFLDEFRDFRRL